MQKSEDITKLSLALTKAQAEMGGAVTDSDNPFFKSKYADLGSIIRVIKPPFKKHGLAYSQFPITHEDRIGVETVIIHSSGQFMSNEFTMRVPKADPQSAGGVISYCRRYALQAVCGVPSVDSDGEEYMQIDREEEERKAREEEEKKKARAEERKAVKEGMILQSQGMSEPQPEDYIWPGQAKHHKKTLGWIAKNDPSYLRETITKKYDLIKEQDEDLLKAMESVISKLDDNGKQDFADAK